MDAAKKKKTLCNKPFADLTLHYIADQRRHDKESHSVDNEETGKHGEDNKPKPEEDIDLLIDHVNRQQTEGVLSLGRVRGLFNVYW